MVRSIEPLYARLLDTGKQKEVFGDCAGIEPAGEGYIAECPFHDDDHPTLLIRGDRPEFFCFACSARGDLISYLTRRRALPFGEALRELGRISGMPCPAYAEEDWRLELERTMVLETAQAYFTAQLWSEEGETALAYLVERGYTHAEIDGMALGFYPGYVRTRAFLVDQGCAEDAVGRTLRYLFNRDMESYRIAIPYRDACGRLMGLVGRRGCGARDGAYRPFTDLEPLRCSPLLLDRARGCPDMVVVEGYLDALLAGQVGVRGVLGVGRSGLSPDKAARAAHYGAQHLIFVESAHNPEMVSSGVLAGQGRGLKTSVVHIPASYRDVDEFLRAECPSRFGRLVQDAGGCVTMAMCEEC